ncbi:diaminobutyrate--pyruvate aminotransferase protein [Rhizobium etli CFN 42]|uniref:Diaminobutyrate--pyruvate aminotransferase protein n=1 Tax=Rhizobium etli (strain ATCC 51251 / DSM 11541 / JCM 21823 / NBRC 15573 / CFN 42) TaxID=347834 RepID=Q2K8S2_RHIEC|nr:aspartate aminotransferase family protein [Rhizobium etli]ABC90764.1 diaminobutyrate--pyruvate aminotransferase protein [Rhizobium etli CFN 42]
MFELIPEDVPKVLTEFRRIGTRLPVPESVAVLSEIFRNEPPSVLTQFPTVWTRASGSQIFDPYGNIWLDWTSGVIAANLGHGSEAVGAAIIEVASRPLLHSYVYPTLERAAYLNMVKEVLGYEKALLLTTGSEAVEAAIKIALRNGASRGKEKIVSFDYAFHGRTMGAQSAGGIAAQQTWLPQNSRTFTRIPFPARDSVADGFDPVEPLSKLEEEGGGVAAVLIEPYQGSSLKVADKAAVANIEKWCRAHNALLICDEVQAGFGRTGRMFGYEYLNIEPDLVCCGKGISNGFPMAMVLCSNEVVRNFNLGELSSTHSGNPLGLAAATAVLNAFTNSNILANVTARSAQLLEGLHAISAEFHPHIEDVRGVGLAAGLVFKDPRICALVAKRSWQSGLLVFAPIGREKTILKFTPPLSISAEQIADGLLALHGAVSTVVETIGGHE